ncbi:thioredoxin domain-containing protein [uncultured Fusobacterium sp.]|uniref:thioredoxin family protein n=1 Tax=uncultured Fusobacterium sp. TaxID=159267 RepID=UPI0025E4289F|nr:thioredoxin domain-containing protein [uncultured Fusobacterium sp.]
MNTLVNLNDLTFSEHIKKEKGLIILNFIAEWCGPCKILAPILETISKEESIKVFKVNVDENPDLAFEYGITSVPVTMFIDEGSRIGQINGMKSKEEFREKLNEFRQFKFL